MGSVFQAEFSPLTPPRPARRTPAPSILLLREHSPSSVEFLHGWRQLRRLAGDLLNSLQTLKIKMKLPLAPARKPVCTKASSEVLDK